MLSAKDLKITFNAGTPIETRALCGLSLEIPSGQFVTPQQIGELAQFLCSGAADNMRGAELKIDGGWTAQ